MTDDRSYKFCNPEEFPPIYVHGIEMDSKKKDSFYGSIPHLSRIAWTQLIHKKNYTVISFISKEDAGTFNDEANHCFKTIDELSGNNFISDMDKNNNRFIIYEYPETIEEAKAIPENLYKYFCDSEYVCNISGGITFLFGSGENMGYDMTCIFMVMFRDLGILRKTCRIDIIIPEVSETKSKYQSVVSRLSGIICGIAFASGWSTTNLIDKRPKPENGVTLSYWSSDISDITVSNFKKNYPDIANLAENIYLTKDEDELKSNLKVIMDNEDENGHNM